MDEIIVAVLKRAALIAVVGFMNGVALMLAFGILHSLIAVIPAVGLGFQMWGLGAIIEYIWPFDPTFLSRWG